MLFRSCLVFDFAKSVVFSDKIAFFATKFIKIITQNVKEKEERLLSLAYNSLRKRVAIALVDITSKFNLKEHTMPIEISREEIAQYVGTATESLIRTLHNQYLTRPVHFVTIISNLFNKTAKK